MKLIDRFRSRSSKIKFYSNRLHKFNAMIYIIIVYCFAILASYYSYSLEKNAILQTNREAINEIYRYYEHKHDNFWTVFVPIYQRNEYYQAIIRLMNAENSNELADAILRGNLVDMLDLSAMQDSDIIWILLYRNQDGKAYVFNPHTRTISDAPSDFPYLEQLRDKSTVRQIYGARTMFFNNEDILVYGIAGDAYSHSQGSLLVGYRSDSLNTIYKNYSFKAPTRILITAPEGEIIYDSGGSYDSDLYNKIFLENATGKVTDSKGNDYFVETAMKTNRNFKVSYIVEWQNLNRTASKNIPAILGTGTLFALVSAALHFLAGHLISRRVGVIMEGLRQIGRHNLSYRIPADSSADEFGMISRQINIMTQELENNIQKLYIYQIRQKTAELGELQSKFNPHFLYNTLEVIRGQLQEKGNYEASEMIMLLARIFRSFITGKPFVTIQEEIAYCNTYLELFRLRYLDRIRIVFDIQSAVLQYGIIRNLLQPLIENYFIHGFDPSEQENLLTISGRIEDDSIVLVVEDNGLGMPQEQLEKVQKELQVPEQLDSSGYGLKNINDRIRVFYGSKYGISINSRMHSGTRITMRIKKLSLDEHHEQMKV